MIDFSLLKKTRRGRYSLTYWSVIYLLVFIFLYLSILTSVKWQLYDVSQLIEKRHNSLLSYLSEHCFHNLKMSSCLLWILIFASFTPFGLVLSYFILAFKSYSIGVTLCGMYFNFRFKGILFGSLVFLPGMFTSLYSIILLMPTSNNISFAILKQFYSKEYNDILSYIKQYLPKIIKSIYLIFLGCILDFISYSIFWLFK